MGRRQLTWQLEDNAGSPVACNDKEEHGYTRAGLGPALRGPVSRGWLLPMCNADGELSLYPCRATILPSCTQMWAKPDAKGSSVQCVSSDCVL